MMKKRLIALLLVLVTMLGMLPGAALAADTEEEALGEVDIFNGGYEMYYLSMNGRVRKQSYTYFNYVNSKGETKEIPAYCVNPTTKGVPQTVSPGQSIKYLAEEKGSDPKVRGIIANGYPTRGLSELKLENKYQAFYATKMALWCYLIPIGISDSGGQSQSDRQGASAGTGDAGRSQRHLCARHHMEQDSLAARDGYSGSGHGVFCYSGRSTVPAADIYRQFGYMGMQLYSQGFVYRPQHCARRKTRIVDMDNKDITAITTSNTGGSFAGKFKVLYPASAVAGKTGSVQLSFSADVYKYAVFYATCAETGKYGQLQNYMCDTDPTVTMQLSAYSNYADHGDTPVPDTSLKIIKLEKSGWICRWAARSLRWSIRKARPSAHSAQGRTVPLPSRPHTQRQLYSL